MAISLGIYPIFRQTQMDEKTMETMQKKHAERLGMFTIKKNMKSYNFPRGVRHIAELFWT